MSKAKLALALGTLIVVTGWAVPQSGAAHFLLRRSTTQRPLNKRAEGSTALAPIRFRDERQSGVLVQGWINGAGPFTFAIDTGTDVSLVIASVTTTAGLHITRAKRPIVAGLSKSPIASNQEASAEFALGTKNNRVPTAAVIAIVQTLPGGIDGILNPSDLFGTLAYSIDFPNRQLLVFDPKTNGLDLSRTPRDGAVVRWLREAGSDCPFVRLDDGRRALIDTGSGFGLAVNEAAAVRGNKRSPRVVGDLGGGVVQSRPLAPATVSIGGLELRGVPTDLIIGAPPGTPLILGRRALYPFKITFDPISRLIAFEPVENAGR